MKILLLVLYLLTLAAGLLLRALNLRHLKRHGHRIPPGFEGAIDPEVLRRTTDYTLAQSRAVLVESLFGGAVLMVFLFAGGLSLYDRWIGSLTDSFIVGGVLFFLGLHLAQAILDIPFSLYRNFSIEKRFGFNTMTARLWLSDLVKSTAISTALLAVLAAGAFALIRVSPGAWWLWVWAFFAMATLFLMFLSPYVIEPLFHTFEPVRRDGLEERIRELMDRAGLRVSAVLQVDASRRSRHSNAYFTGIGRVKRIVLYDTLIEQMKEEEILAVLAHEVGHWKKGHVLKRLLVAELFSLLVCYLSFHLLGWDGLPALLGLEKASFFARLVILGFIGSLAAFPFTPLASWSSRRHEWQADRFARELTGRSQALASALIKLSRENLANLHPHPLYAWFHYSHPPVVERIRVLRST